MRVMKGLVPLLFLLMAMMIAAIIFIVVFAVGGVLNVKVSHEINLGVQNVVKGDELVALFRADNNGVTYLESLGQAIVKGDQESKAMLAGLLRPLRIERLWVFEESPEQPLLEVGQKSEKQQLFAEVPLPGGLSGKIKFLAGVV